MHLSKSEIRRYNDGEHPDSERVRAHLENCPRCQNLATELQAQVKWVQ
jgi:anti-sigma factor RsiW